MSNVATIEHDTLDVAQHPDFPDYDVHSDGTVVSHIFKRPRTLKPIRMGEYCGLQLRDSEGVSRKIYLHRLVCEAFHGPCPDGCETRHKDGDRLHNAKDNLCWGTRSENMRDKEGHGTAPIGERHGGAKLTEADVLEMRRMRRAGASLPVLMQKFGVSRMTCWRAVSGRQWTHI